MKKSILSLLLLFASSCLNAGEIQPLDTLRNKIEGYVLNKLTAYSEGKVQVSVGKINSRLNLKTCANDKLEVFNPYETPMLSTNTMGIKCQEEKNHWTLYVPIKIVVLKTVLLTKHALQKGTKLNSDHFYQAEMDAQKLKQGYFTKSKELAGLICKNAILADSPLHPYNVELPKMVIKGQEVVIIAASGGLRVSMDGVALSDGTLGEVIKVKNSSSKRIIEAQVSGKKKVQVVL